MFYQDHYFAEAFRAGGGDKFRVHDAEHSFAHEPCNFAREIEAKRDGRQNRVPRRFPQSGGKQSPVNGKGHHQQRPDHEPRDANRKQREKAADVIAELSMTDRGVKAKWNADAFRKAEREEAEYEGNGKALTDDVVDAVVA